MGALPDTYTAYRSVGDEEVARSFEAAWGVDVPREKGLTIPQMFDAAVAGDLKAMYIFGEDVAQTDPNTAHVVAALENLEFMVCQDIFETETTKYADVILPASSFLEKSGTFTNAERRIQLVAPAIEPPGEREDRLRDHQDDLERARPRAGLGRPRGRDARDRRADAALRRRHLRADRPRRPAVAGRARRHRRADPLRARVRYARRARALRRAALQGAGRRRQRRLPADPRHRPPPAALQRGHDDAPHRQPRAQRPRLPRDPPRRRRPRCGSRTATRSPSAAARAGSRSPPR